jgi:hypothetical protein
MNKKLFGLVPLMAVTAFMVIPAAAQAQQWYKKGKPITSTPVTTTTSGNLILNALGQEIKCKLNDAEEIWNPASGPGEDNVVAFTLSGCKAKKSSSACPKGAVEVIANALPWRSVLLAGPPIRDEILKVRLILRCAAGTVGDEFEGSLTPEVGNGSLNFGGPGGGTLTDGFLNPMTLTGKDSIKAPPGKITAL